MEISRRVQSVSAPTLCARPAPTQVPARGMKEVEPRVFVVDDDQSVRTSLAASASCAFTELLSAFNQKLGEISGDRVRIHLVNPGDRPRVHRVRPARLRSKRVDREGCR
jgi:hypothetical protein